MAGEAVAQGGRGTVVNPFITLYRCAECGKWSHAQRKPKFHKRFTSEWPEQDAVILEEIYPQNDYEGGGDDGGWILKCGPFDTYRAYKEAVDD